MTQRPTIRDVARVAGVSLGTASRVINGLDNVALELRSSVEHAIASLGYRPNPQARSIRSGATRSMGIVISDIGIPTLAAFVRAAQTELQAAGYSVLIGCHDHAPARELDLLRFMDGRGVDGLIISTCAGASTELDDIRARLGIPLVLYDRSTPETADVVCIDHREAMRAATNYLLDLGHRRVGLITGLRRLYPAKARLEGYADAHADHGYKVDRSLIRAESFAASAAQTQTAVLLDAPNRPTALILGGVDFLPGALQAIRDRGLALPRDLSLIASSDSDLASLATPPITVLSWNFADAGRHCAQVLLARLANGAAAARQQISFKATLVRRASCSPPRLSSLRSE